MRLNKSFFLILFILLPFFTYAKGEHLSFAKEKLESRNEIYFFFEPEDFRVLQELSEFISIDNIIGEKVYAYANAVGFQAFLSYGFDFLPVYDYYYHTKSLTMANSVEEMENWDRYPTHDVYMEMMLAFQQNNPDMARLDTIGTSVNGYPIVCIAISNNINDSAPKPKFWWSGTMHGDELIAYYLLLRLADYLLNNYGIDEQVTNLLNETYVYINPLANPDGTFFGSADYSDVSQSIRSNINGYDLNRNFPRLDNVPTELQPETLAMMDYAENNNFTMSANGHSGAECINYPWDFWNSSQNVTADDLWWQYISWIYADNAHQNSPPGYFTSVGNGVTNGGDWYVVQGSRQDYMNYFSNLRETTLEWSNIKKIDASELDNYWQYNKQALFDYTEQVIYGIRGTVINACTGESMPNVKIEIQDHDRDNSEVYTFDPLGNFYRPIYQGTYYVTFSASGFHNYSTEIEIENNSVVILDVEMIPDNMPVPDFYASQFEIFEADSILFYNITSGAADDYLWTFPGGIPEFYNQENPSYISYYNEGSFDVKLEVVKDNCTITKKKDNYVKVFPSMSPEAGFVADATEISAHNYVSFTDTSTNNPEYRLWTFQGGSPGQSEMQNPQILYTTPGSYNVKLFVSNQYGEDELVKYGYITVNLPEVCEAGSSNPDMLHITNFSIESIDNNSGAEYYSDYTNISTNLTLGETYSFSVQSSQILEGNQCLIYVDWNGDGVFDETNDLVFESEVSESDFFSGNFTVPEDAMIGDVRLRIRLHNTSNDPNPSPCGFSGYGEVEDYTLNLKIPELPPVADFYAVDTYSCNGYVSFICNSLFAVDWLWDFGDGNFSTDKNPVHYYEQSGYYSVKLIAINPYGQDSIVIENYINVDRPDLPATENASSCGEDYLTLSAYGSGDIYWFENLYDEDAFFVGNVITDFFDQSETYYVQNIVEQIESYFVGKTNSDSYGGNHTNNSYYLIFDAHQNFTLNSVEVNASESGNRVIELRNSSSQVVESIEVFIEEGVSRIDLDFYIPEGDGYQLRCGTNVPNLWRNDENVNYPYVVDDIVSITESNAGENWYYYFYDWEISATTEYCKSPKIPIYANIFPELFIDFEYENETEINAGDAFATVIPSGGEEPFSYLWSNGDTTQTITNLEPGVYYVTVFDNNSCSAEGNVIIFTCSILTEDDNFSIDVFPNPVDDKLIINSIDFFIKRIRIFNKLGQPIIEELFSVNKNQIVDASYLNTGMYFIEIQTYCDRVFRTKFIKK